jgi:hypothetical protein
MVWENKEMNDRAKHECGANRSKDAQVAGDIKAVGKELKEELKK